MSCAGAHCLLTVNGRLLLENWDEQTLVWQVEVWDDGEEISVSSSFCSLNVVTGMRS